MHLENGSAGLHDHGLACLNDIVTPPAENRSTETQTDYMNLTNIYLLSVPGTVAWAVITPGTGLWWLTDGYKLRTYYK